MIDILDRGHRTTVVAFSGLAPRNHLFEWSSALSGLPANFVGIKDPYDCWYQWQTQYIVEQLQGALARLPRGRLIFLGGSAGGFAALMVGRWLAVDRVLAFCPQSACGTVKRALGDDRWPQFCWHTPGHDIAGRHPRAIVYYATDDALDAMHAGRLTADLRPCNSGGHNLPRLLKERGELQQVLMEVLDENVCVSRRTGRRGPLR